VDVTLADAVALALRAAGLAATLQAAGLPLFVALCGRQLRQSPPLLATFGSRITAAGLALALAEQLMGPARLAGSFSGVFDASLQAMLLQSSVGTATLVRVAGLALLLGRLRVGGRLATALGVVGVAAVVGSFTLMGHTTSHEPRWALATLLAVHLCIIAFWFGAFAPLRIVVATEEPAVASAVVARFSRWAVRLVPVILVAGLLLAALILPGVRSIGTPFGLALAAKLVGFVVLLGLGALNYRRLGPSIATGTHAAAAALRRSLAAEWLLVVAVLGVTAVLTGLLSPTG
jgi:putative copper export protein